MIKVIGLAGRRGSGKNTVARYIAQHLGMPCREVAFADSLRNAAAAICGFTPHQMTDPVLKEEPDSYWGFSPRWFLQNLGTEVVRSIDPGMWVRAWRRKAGALISSGHVVIATDVRFPNEVAAVRDMGGKVLRVVRPWGGPETGAVDAHPSEHALDDVKLDSEVMNTATLGKLSDRVRDLVEDMLRNT